MSLNYCFLKSLSATSLSASDSATFLILSNELLFFSGIFTLPWLVLCSCTTCIFACHVCTYFIWSSHLFFDIYFFLLWSLPYLNLYFECLIGNKYAVYSFRHFNIFFPLRPFPLLFGLVPS